MLSRASLPREELVAALVEVCGGDKEAWVAARRRLAAGLEPADEPADEPAHEAAAPARRRWPVRLLAGAAVAALSVAGVAATAAVLDDRTGRRASPERVTMRGLPDPGPYRILAVHSGLCLSEDSAKDTGHVHQTKCPDQFPPMTLDARGEGVYRVRTDHPQFGPGCMGLDGDIVVDGYCGRRPTEKFWLEPVSKPVRGFRMRPVVRR